MSNIFTIIEEYEKDFLEKPVTIVDGYEFDQLRQVKTNQRYYAGKFETGNEDEFGYKYFYNIGKSRVKNAAKNIDIDTKDVNIRADKPGDYYKAWIMRRDVAKWMKTRKLGKIFNESAVLTPKYGSFVVKKVAGEEIIRKVNLKNLKCDPTAESLEMSGWVIEDHYYTPAELKQEVKARGWDKEAVDKAIKSYMTHRKENYDDGANKDDKGSAQYIHVKEFSGDVPESLYYDDGDEDTYMLCNFIVISRDKGGRTEMEEAKKEGLILYKKELKTIGYKECHYDREEGRWLGVGIIEDLIDAQIMKNEEINQVMLGLKLANLILYQTGDETTARNILTDLVNGDIIKAKGEISRINTQNIGLGNDQFVSQEIEKVANDLSNSYEVTTGATLPSGTPYALGSLINQNANRLFDFVRENLGLFWQEVFEEWIIPELSKDLNKAHLLELTDKEEMEWVVKQANRSMTWDAIKQYIIEEGKSPTVGQIEVVEQVLTERLTSKDSIYLDIKQNSYDFAKSISIDFTDERLSKGQELTTLSTIMQLLSGNPELADSPVMQKILDLTGHSTIDVSQKSTAKTSAQPTQVTPQAVQGLQTV